MTKCPSQPNPEMAIHSFYYIPDLAMRERKELEIQQGLPFAIGVGLKMDNVGRSGIRQSVACVREGRRAHSQAHTSRSRLLVALSIQLPVHR